jgi:hypothetical protein
MLTYIHTFSPRIESQKSLPQSTQRSINCGIVKFKPLNTCECVFVRTYVRLYVDWHVYAYVIYIYIYHIYIYVYIKYRRRIARSREKSSHEYKLHAVHRLYCMDAYIRYEYECLEQFLFYIHKYIQTCIHTQKVSLQRLANKQVS